MPSKIRLIPTVLAGCGAAWLSARGVYLPPNKPLTKLSDLNFGVVRN